MYTTFISSRSSQKSPSLERSTQSPTPLTCVVHIFVVLKRPRKGTFNEGEVKGSPHDWSMAKVLASYLYSWPDKNTYRHHIHSTNLQWTELRRITLSAYLTASDRPVGVVPVALLLLLRERHHPRLPPADGRPTRVTRFRCGGVSGRHPRSPRDLQSC